MSKTPATPSESSKPNDDQPEGGKGGGDAQDKQQQQPPFNQSRPPRKVLLQAPERFSQFDFLPGNQRPHGFNQTFTPHHQENNFTPFANVRAFAEPPVELKERLNNAELNNIRLSEQVFRLSEERDAVQRKYESAARAACDVASSLLNQLYPGLSLPVKEEDDRTGNSNKRAPSREPPARGRGDCNVRQHADLQHRYNNMEVQLKQTRKGLERQAGDIKELKRKYNDAQRERDHERRKLDNLEAKYAETRDDAIRYRKERDELRKECEKRQDAENLANQEKEMREKLAQETAELQGEVDRLTVQNGEKSSTIEQLNERLEAMARQINELSSQNAQYRDQIRELNEKASAMPPQQPPTRANGKAATAAAAASNAPTKKTSAKTTLSSRTQPKRKATNVVRPPPPADEDAEDLAKRIKLEPADEP